MLFKPDDIDVVFVGHLLLQDMSQSVLDMNDVFVIEQ